MSLVAGQHCCQGANACVLYDRCAVQVLRRSPFGADWYVLGDAPASYAAADTSNSAEGVFTARPLGVTYPPRLLDYGSSKQLRLLPSALKMLMCFLTRLSIQCLYSVFVDSFCMPF